MKKLFDFAVQDASTDETVLAGSVYEAKVVGETTYEASGWNTKTNVFRKNYDSIDWAN